ncbi:MAG: ComF family protein [Tidjanibacter sp.]|nr:ComF family protein [Tidjanibacter sp.]
MLRSLIALFLPRRCPACGEYLIEGEQTFCTRCRMEAPLTTHPTEAHNPLLDHMRTIVPTEHAAALLAFPKGSGWRRAVHEFKYAGSWRVAEECGRWLGEALAEGGLFYDVDLIIPVPLHRRKLLKRGYNQAEYIARGVAAALQRPYSTGHLRRVKNNPSQALKRSEERWGNVEGIFSVVRAEELKGKHILLVDDVITSGATIGSSAEALIGSVEGVRISVCAIASAHYF